MMGYNPVKEENSTGVPADDLIQCIPQQLGHQPINMNIYGSGHWYGIVSVDSLLFCGRGGQLHEVNGRFC